jgi:hypothetical protein
MGNENRCGSLGASSAYPFLSGELARLYAKLRLSKSKRIRQVEKMLAGFCLLGVGGSLAVKVRSGLGK